MTEKEPKPLRIQDQMVEKGTALVDTDVGKFMNDELISLQKKYEKDLQDIKREHQMAIKEKYDLLKEILEEQQAMVKKILKRAAAERKYLADLHEVQMGRLEEALGKESRMIGR